MTSPITVLMETSLSLHGSLFDYVPEESAMRFLSGSHNGPMYAPRRSVDHSPYGYDGFEDVPNINEEKKKLRTSDHGR